ncbi:MAG: FKBP-type peptidyl-prolyl cis-trans isomerase, partial [SAR324 cluster bacterium]
FDFEGTLDGKPFPGSSGKDQRSEIGAGHFLKDIEAQFPGMTAEQSKAFDLTFAPDFPQPSLAGKTVQFQVTVHKVEKAVPAALTGEFFARFGKIETEAQFRDAIRERLKGEGESTRLSAWRQSLADQIRAPLHL